MCGAFALPAAAGLSLASGLMGASNSIKQGNYQSSLLRQNAILKNQAADETVIAANTSADWQRVKAGQAIGTQRSAQAANGIDVNSGSSAQLQDDTALLGELDALTIQNNAAREAYGLRVQANQDMANAKQVKKNAGSSAMGSILGGAGSAFGFYAGSK